MSEFWYAEAAIDTGRRPDWQAARRAIDESSVDDLSWCFDEYTQLLDEALLADRRCADEADVLTAVRARMQADLDAVVAALHDGHPHVCTVETACVRVFVYVSGWGSAPDELCDAWLRLQSLGLLQAAGFLDTRTAAPLD